MSKPLPGSFFNGPVVDPQTGYFLPHVLKYFQGLEIKTGPTLDLKSQIQNTAVVAGRTEGIGTTVSKHDATGKLIDADQIAADGATYGRTLGTALTANQVDLSKAGVIGPLGSSKVRENVMFNYSNNATADSIDNGVNATVRVYGPGGVGTTWHQIIGNVAGAEIPAYSGAFAYSTDVWIYYNGSYNLTTTASDTLADGVKWAAKIHTVAAGGAGGVSGGGGTDTGGGRGRLV